MKEIRLIIITLCFVIPKMVWSQDYQYGLEISPSFDFQLQTANNNTWGVSRGNGFLFGTFLDFKINEHSYIGSALKFEYVAFNQKSGDFLSSSFRMSSLNVPITFKQEIGVTKHWFYSAGIGLNYIFLSRQLFFGNFINVNNLVNQWQPYLNAGINYLMDSHFEIGMHARFHPLNLWTENIQTTTQASARLFSFDFSLRYTISSS
ncbi:MAG: hypothetical protein AB8B72_06360 [Crocinitomicaceae bacterium]